MVTFYNQHNLTRQIHSPPSLSCSIQTVGFIGCVVRDTISTQCGGSTRSQANKSIQYSWDTRLRCASIASQSCSATSRRQSPVDAVASSRAVIADALNSETSRCQEPSPPTQQPPTLSTCKDPSLSSASGVMLVVSAAHGATVALAPVMSIISHAVYIDHVSRACQIKIVTTLFDTYAALHTEVLSENVGQGIDSSGLWMILSERPVSTWSSNGR